MTDIYCPINNRYIEARRVIPYRTFPPRIPDTYGIPRYLSSFAGMYTANHVCSSYTPCYVHTLHTHLLYVLTCTLLSGSDQSVKELSEITLSPRGHLSMSKDSHDPPIYTVILIYLFLTICNIPATHLMHSSLMDVL